MGVFAGAGGAAQPWRARPRRVSLLRRRAAGLRDRLRPGAEAAARAAWRWCAAVAARTPRTDVLAAVGVVAVWFAAVGLLAGSSYWYPASLEHYWLMGWWLLPVLALRRSAPGPVLWVLAVAYPWSYARPLISDLHLAPVLVATFCAAVAEVAPVVVTGLVGTAAGIATSVGWWQTTHPLDLADQVMSGRLDGYLDPSSTVTRVLAVVAVTVIGTTLGRLQSTRRTLEQRNAQLLALQEVRARAAVRAERTRIARELHDVVAHHVSAIVVRAQAADRVADDDPEQPRAAVRWIAVTGREALDAMRSVVRVLREEEARDTLPPEPTDAAGDPDATPVRGVATMPVPLAPVDTLAQLPATLARVADAGLRVRADLPDPMPVLPPAVQLAVLRVATEALTNVLLHSAAARARLGLQVDAGRLRLQVVDDGPVSPDPEPGGGHGLANMRERASVVGGALSAGPCGAGWAVELVVPIAPAPVTTSPVGRVAAVALIAEHERPTERTGDRP